MKGKSKKNDGETGSIIIEKSEPPVLPKYDFSGQLAVYLLKGSRKTTLRPAVLSYSENHEKVYPLTGSKTAAGLTINYRMQIKSGLLAEKTMRCVSKTVVMQQS